MGRSGYGFASSPRTTHTTLHAFVDNEQDTSPRQACLYLVLPIVTKAWLYASLRERENDTLTRRERRLQRAARDAEIPELTCLYSEGRRQSSLIPAFTAWCTKPGAEQRSTAQPGYILPHSTGPPELTSLAAIDVASLLEHGVPIGPSAPQYVCYGGWRFRFQGQRCPRTTHTLAVCMYFCFQIQNKYIHNTHDRSCFHHLTKQSEIRFWPM